MRIRPAIPADLPACAALYEAGQREIHPGHDPAAWSPAGFATATAGEEVSVATAADGEVVGFLSLWRQEPFVHFLHVARNWRRRGVGEALLRHALATVSGPVDLKCLPGNRGALAFYRRLGWTEVERDITDGLPHVRLRSPG